LIHQRVDAVGNAFGVDVAGAVVSAGEFVEMRSRGIIHAERSCQRIEDLR
jgi:hypothetical protein